MSIFFKERGTSPAPQLRSAAKRESDLFQERGVDEGRLFHSPKSISSREREIIWVLKDDRAGNYSQAIGLAEAMALQNGSEICIKDISYGFLARVPNFLKISGLWGIDSKSRLGILDPLICEEEKPDIVISAGRKTAPIAAFLRKKYQAFAVQIMHPNLDFGKFDLVVLPSHDRKVEAKNVVRVLGSLGRVNKDLLEKEYQKFSDIFEKIESPRIVLLVGGSSKKGIFSEKIAQNLGKQVSNVVNQMQGNLVVLNSRRTGDKVSEILDQNLNCPKTFFKWQSPDWQNPYFASLQAADFVIATGDSISMCCEICALGKPVYIFNPPEICSSKHLKFHQDLFDGGFAKRLDEDLRILEKFDSKKLQETAKIAQLPILDRL